MSGRARTLLPGTFRKCFVLYLPWRFLPLPYDVLGNRGHSLHRGQCLHKPPQLRDLRLRRLSPEMSCSTQKRREQVLHKQGDDCGHDFHLHARLAEHAHWRLHAKGEGGEPSRAPWAEAGVWLGRDGFSGSHGLHSP